LPGPFPIRRERSLSKFQGVVVNRKTILLGSLALGAGVAMTRKLLAASAPAQDSLDRATLDAIDAYVEAQMRRLKMPGVSLAIVDGDEIVHLRGFGRADAGREPPTPQTPFLIGSLTKSFTALAVMQLVEAGKVMLDAPVQHYLPWFRVADPVASARMTVRHLLNQTSGISTLAGTICLADSDDGPEAVERQARGLSTLALNHPVGASFQYCNLNYNLLGLVIEAASGRAYAEYLQEHIFDPLDMRHTHACQATEKRNDLAMGHRYWFSFPVAAPNIRFPLSSLPAGGLISTSEDLAGYLIAHLNGGRYGKAQILSGAGIDELHRGVAEQRVMGNPVASYGMGWFVTKIGRTKVVSHGGNVPQFSSHLALLPEHKKGAVLLVNADHGLPFILDEVGAGVAALLAGEQPPPVRYGFFPWVMRALPLIPLLQVAGVFATLRLARRWRQDPALRPSGGRLLGQHILLPLIPNLSLAAILAYLRSSRLLPFVHLYMPDLAWTARISGSLAGGWAFLRTGLMLRALRRPRA
jgi:CubicO group peptidase (beta-lactamase class C family)